MRNELLGGLEATVIGLTTAIGPVLFFLGTFGAPSLAAAFWATLITATVVPAVRLLLRGKAFLRYSTRTASLTAYVGLVLQMGVSMGEPSSGGVGLSANQLLAGLAAGSLMFAMASALILLSGLLRLGTIFKMIPSTVTAGIGNSIAILLVWLALKQVMHSGLMAAATASAMLICISGWSKFRTRVTVFRFVPAIIVAVAAGLAMSVAVEPAALEHTGAVVYDLEWISVRSWPSVLNRSGIAPLLVAALPGTITLALVMILESFTAAGILEKRLGVRIDPNRELLVMGGTNLASAMLGGVPCTGAPLVSMASWIVGGRGLLAALTSLVLTGALLIAIGPWLLALPAGIVAGLFLIQAPMMVDPAFKNRLLSMLLAPQWRKMGEADLGFWITVVISLVGIFGSLIWVSFVGISLSCLVVLRRVSVNLTAQWAYLDQYRSHRARSLDQLTSLDRMVHHVGILRLTGHLFFGNSARLAQLFDELHQEAAAVVIDVSEVHDVDPSGSDALVWLIGALLDRRLKVVLTGLRRSSSMELQQTLQDMAGVEYNIDMDRGLELCEELILQNSDVMGTRQTVIPLASNALLSGLAPDELTAVLLLCEQREVDMGSELFHKGAPADGIWLLESGSVSILAGGDNDSTASRLATFGPGQFVGEMGYIDGKPRSATARADTPVRAMLLDKQAIETLVEQLPKAALKITSNIARELSLRVRNVSALLVNESAEASSGWANSSLGAASRF